MLVHDLMIGVEGSRNFGSFVKISICMTCAVQLDCLYFRGFIGFQLSDIIELASFFHSSRLSFSYFLFIYSKTFNHRSL